MAEKDGEKFVTAFLVQSFDSIHNHRFTGVGERRHPEFIDIASFFIPQYSRFAGDIGETVSSLSVGVFQPQFVDCEFLWYSPVRIICNRGANHDLYPDVRGHVLEFFEKEGLVVA